MAEEVKDNTHLFKKEDSVVAKEEAPKQESEAPREVKLVIFATEGQPVQVSGPINDEMLCTWLLRKAEKILDVYWQRQGEEMEKAKNNLMGQLFGKKTKGAFGNGRR